MALRLMFLYRKKPQGIQKKSNIHLVTLFYFDMTLACWKLIVKICLQHRNCSTYIATAIKKMEKNRNMKSFVSVMAKALIFCMCQERACCICAERMLYSVIKEKKRFVDYVCVLCVLNVLSVWCSESLFLVLRISIWSLLWHRK